MRSVFKIVEGVRSIQGRHSSEKAFCLINHCIGQNNALCLYFRMITQISKAWKRDHILYFVEHSPLRFLPQRVSADSVRKNG